VSYAAEIRQAANEVVIDRPDIANRLLRIAIRVAQMELQLDDIMADMVLAEKAAHPPQRIPFKLRLVP
jgi:alkylation response protein AidB-like acyl-CoA dehydrogenase